MMKKAQSQGAGKEIYKTLSDRLTKNLEEADKLMEQTNLPAYTAVPDHNVLVTSWLNARTQTSGRTSRRLLPSYSAN